MLALIKADEIVTTDVGPVLRLPDGAVVSPTYSGWQNGDYRLAEVQRADVPEGKIVLSRSYSVGVDGSVVEAVVLGDIPAEHLLAHLAEVRWRHEVGGTTWNGWNVPTDDKSQARYASEVLAAQTGARADGDPWKFPHGFEALSNEQVEAMATAARVHVLACFAKEVEIAAQIGSGSITTFAAIDAAFVLGEP